MKHKRPSPISVSSHYLPKGRVAASKHNSETCYSSSKVLPYTLPATETSHCATVPTSSKTHPPPQLHHKAATCYQKKPKQNKQKNWISREGYCSTRSIARDIISSTPGLTPYLHSRARASSLWTVDQEEWCCRSHGARCTLSHSRCFSSGVHMPEQIIQHGLLAQSHRRSLTKAEQAWAGPLIIHKPIVLSLHSTVSR